MLPNPSFPISPLILHTVTLSLLSLAAHNRRRQQQLKIHRKKMSYAVELGVTKKLNPRIEYSLDAEKEYIEFDKLQFLLRQVKRIRIRENDQLLEDIDIQELDLVSENRRIRLMLKVDNYYFIGYQKIPASKVNKLWEARQNKFGKRCLERSTLLPFTVNYSGSISHREFGYGVIKQAFNTLWHDTPPNSPEIEPAFQTIALNICEPARFQPCFYSMLSRLKFGTYDKIPEFMLDMVNNWEDISDVAKKKLRTTYRIPQELDENEIRSYEAYEFQDLLDTKITAAAPHYARSVVRVFHIKGKTKEES